MASIKKLIKNKKGSPLVEEGLLVGLAILAVGLLIVLVVNILNWAGLNIDQLISNIGKLLPFYREMSLRKLMNLFMR